MAWTVELHPEFEPEFDALAEAVQDELLALLHVLEAFGPGSAGRGWARSRARGTRT